MLRINSHGLFTHNFTVEAIQNSMRIRKITKLSFITAEIRNSGSRYIDLGTRVIPDNRLPRKDRKNYEKIGKITRHKHIPTRFFTKPSLNISFCGKSF